MKQNDMWEHENDLTSLMPSEYTWGSLPSLRPYRPITCSVSEPHAPSASTTWRALWFADASMGVWERATKRMNEQIEDGTACARTVTEQSSPAWVHEQICSVLWQKEHKGHKKRREGAERKRRCDSNEGEKKSEDKGDKKCDEWGTCNMFLCQLLRVACSYNEKQVSS